MFLLKVDFRKILRFAFMLHFINFFINPFSGIFSIFFMINENRKLTNQIREKYEKVLLLERNIEALQSNSIDFLEEMSIKVNGKLINNEKELILLSKNKKEN